MSIITTFYSDEEKTNALYPITKTKAIYDDNNINLEQRLNNIQTEIQNAGGFYGIDETNIIANNSGTVHEYVATEDCYCTFSTNWGGAVARKINGVEIDGYIGRQGRPIDIWLKNGQKLTLTESNGTLANINGLRVFSLKK